MLDGYLLYYKGLVCYFRRIDICRGSLLFKRMFIKLGFFDFWVKFISSKFLLFFGGRRVRVELYINNIFVFFFLKV